MAITVDEAKRIATELLAEEQKILTEIENQVDEQIKRNFDPELFVVNVTFMLANNRVYKALMRKYEAAGWSVEVFNVSQKEMTNGIGWRMRPKPAQTSSNSYFDR